MVQTLGRKPGTPDVGFGEIAPGAARGSIMGRPTKNGWLYYLGIRGGRTGGATPSARLGVYQASSTALTSLVGQTAAFTMPAVMLDGWSGADYGSAPTAALKVYAATTYGLAVLATGAAAGHGQDHSGHIMHERGGLSSLPSPFGSTNSRPEGKMSIWAMIQENRPPREPVVISPADGSLTSDATPTLSARFSDPDETLPGFALGSADKMAHWRFEVMNTARTVRYRDSGKTAANTTDQNDRVAAWDVPTALGAGTYIARCTFWDQFGVPSPTQEWVFTINAGGAASNGQLLEADRISTTLTNLVNPRMSVVWTHSGGLSADRFQMQVINAAGAVVIGPTGELNTTRAPGVELIYSPQLAGLANLTPGQKYKLGMRMRDTTGLWSGWAYTALFTVNSAPGVPTGLTPAHGTVTQDPPPLSAIIPDATDDTATLSTGFQVRIQGDTSDGVYIPSERRYFSAGRHRALPTAEELTTKGIWEWRVRGADPHGLVGEWTAWTAFTYADPPTVTITAPTADAVLTNGTPAVAFTSSAAMTSSQLLIRDNANGAEVYDSGQVATTGTSGSRQVPPGILRNDRTYTAIITAISTLGLTGTASRTFSVAYPSPAAIGSVNVAVSRGPLEMEEDPSEWSRLLISWAAATELQVPDTEFLGYLLRRQDLGTGEEHVLADLPVRGDTTFIDKTALSGRSYRYTVTYRALRNTVDQVESVPAIATGSVILKHAVVASLDEGDVGYPIRYWTDRGVEHVRDQVIIPTFGAKPIAFMGPASSRILTISALVKDNLEHTAAETVQAAVEASEPILGLDGRYSPRVVYWRDPRGRGILAVQSAPRETDAHNRSRSAFEVTFTEIEGSIEVVI